MAQESTAITDLIRMMQTRPAQPVVRDSEPTFFYHRPASTPTMVIARPAVQSHELSPALVMAVAVLIGVFAGILVGFA